MYPPGCKSSFFELAHFSISNQLGGTWNVLIFTVVAGDFKSPGHFLANPNSKAQC